MPDHTTTTCCHGHLPSLCPIGHGATAGTSYGYVADRSPTGRAIATYVTRGDDGILRTTDGHRINGPRHDTRAAAISEARRIWNCE